MTVKKSVWAICSVALLAVAFALPASGQDSGLKVSPIGPSTNIHGTPEGLPPSTYTIYNNFGSPAATNSWVNGGYYILGPTNPLGESQQSIAVAFKPTANSHVKKIQAAVTYSGSGTAEYEQSLAADCAGVPCGTPIAGTAYQAQTAPIFGCCTGADAKTQTFGGAGVALTAGAQYWVVVDANPAADTATEDYWDYPGGPPTAVEDNGSGNAWSSFSTYQTSGAVKVTGTKP